MSIPALAVHATIRNQEARKQDPRNQDPRPVEFVPYGTLPRPVVNTKKHGRRRSGVVYKTNWKRVLTFGLL